MCHMRAWGLGVEIFIFFQTLSRRCAFVRGAEGWQKAPWAVLCPFKKMDFGHTPNDPAGLSLWCWGLRDADPSKKFRTETHKNQAVRPF